MALHCGIKRKLGNSKFKAQLGFSLIEVLIALSLFSFSMLGMASLQISINRMIQDSFEKSRALNLAISRHEVFQLTRSNTNSANQLLTLWEQEFASRFPNMKAYVEEAMHIRVSIIWASSRQGLSNCERKESDLSNKNPENCLRL